MCTSPEFIHEFEEEISTTKNKLTGLKYLVGTYGLKRIKLS